MDQEDIARGIDVVDLQELMSRLASATTCCTHLASVCALFSESGFQRVREVVLYDLQHVLGHVVYLDRDFALAPEPVLEVERVRFLVTVPEMINDPKNLS